MSDFEIELTDGETRLVVDHDIGNYPLWEVGGRSALHLAPWREEPAPEGMDPRDRRRLAGDFFCLPFGADDVEDGPSHGYTARGHWQLAGRGADTAELRLIETPRGAVVTKHVRIAGPVLYQTHVIEGGAGEITLAHHPMARMADGGRLSFSPKRAVLTDPAPQYAGHNLWALNQCREDMKLACEDGSLWDMSVYPKEHVIEDFAILVEAPGARLGWTVLMREAEDDMLVILKDPRVLPVTMLWISNGGRDFPPWNARHTGVLGIEDGCAAGATGLRTAMGENAVRGLGVPTTISLGGRIEVRHAMASLPRPAGWTQVSEVSVSGGVLTLTEAGGESVSVAFDGAFFSG